MSIAAGGRPRRLGVRGRAAIAAIVVVAAVYMAGAVVFVTRLQASLLVAVDEAAFARSRELADQISLGGPMDAETDLLGTERGQVVQLLDDSGQVLATSSRAHPDAVDETPARPGTVVRVDEGHLPLLTDTGPYRTLVRGIDYNGSDYRIVVASSVEAQRQSVRTVLVYLAIGLPLSLGFVGFATWVVVGRALKPVDELRSEVDSISASDLDQRVPIPATGDEIARLAVTMNRMLERLELAQTRQQRFIADASHELRSPLATVLAALELATDESSLEWTDLEPLMRSEAVRMRQLVEDLLVLARADEHGLVLAVDDVDLDDMLESEVVRLRAASNREVIAEIVPVRVEGDRARLTQAVRNLLDNAARASRGKVGISVTAHPDDVQILVDDDGPGVPVEDRSRIFERFVRLDDSRERIGGGSGLGLAIAMQLVTAHGGSLAVLDSPWGGARFEIRLPYHPAGGQVLVQPPAGSSR